MDLDFVSVHKHAKKELGQYPAILTSHLVNNPYILTEQAWFTTHMYIQLVTPHRNWFLNPAIFFIEGMHAKEIT